MLVKSAHKTLFVSGECLNSKRPRGERFEIWLNGAKVGAAPIHEWHINQSSGQNRRTFAVVCESEKSDYETALSESTIDEVEFRETHGCDSVVLHSVTVRSELRLLLASEAHESTLGGNSYGMTSASGDISFNAYVPHTSSDSVEAIVTEIETEAEATLRQQVGLELKLRRCE